MSNKAKFIIFLTFLVFVVFLVKYFHLESYLNISFLKEKISGFGMFAPLMYVFVYMVATVLFLPGSTITIAGGILFGSLLGTLYTIFGATLGAVIAFLFARYLGESFVESLLKNKFQKLMEYDKKLQKNGFLVVLFLRLVPLFPFNALNFGLGLTLVKLKDYFWGTFLGIIPGTFAFAYFGSSLASMDIKSIIFAVLILTVFSFIMPIYNKFRKKEENEFDIAVVGAGAGGLNIASFMAKAGFKTLLVDKKEESIGGDCLNFGCVPSKALIHIAYLAKKAKESEQFGFEVSKNIDIKKVKEYIRKKQDIIRKHENKKYLESLGIEVALGGAEFVSKNEIKVKDKIYKARKIVLATGSRPKKLEIEGSNRVKIWTNENIFNIDKLPKKLLVVGAGPVGMEIAQAFLRLGSCVCVLQNSDRILPKEDKDISDILLQSLKKEGMKFYLNSSPKKFISKNELLIEDKNKNEIILDFDAVFVAVGREINTEGLNLQKAGILMDGKKIKVDKYLRTTNKNVYLCGDVAGKHQFTHAAELHASLILKNFFLPFKKKLNTENLSWVIFTDPQIATFGMQQEQLKEKNIKHIVLEADFSSDDKAIVDDAQIGKVKLFVTKKGKILGGSCIAQNAGEIFQELILAKDSKLKLKNIFNKIYPYPTATRINKKVASLFFAKKLTKTNKKILKILY